MIAFERTESSGVSDVLGEVVPNVRTEVVERAKALSFALEESEFEYACLMKSGESGMGRKATIVQKDKKGRNH